MRITPFALCIFMGAVLFAIPNMTRREILFAVPVPPDFRDTPAGRRAIRAFRLSIVAVVLAGVCALLLASAKSLNAAAIAALISILLVGGVSFYWQNRRIAPAAVQYTRPREAAMTVAPERLPLFAWLGAGPFVILATVVLWLYLNWNRIPVSYPVHFDLSGQPNRWVERTIKGVYGPLLFAAELCTWVLIMALAAWFGSRRLRIRSGVLGAMIALEYLFAVVFSLVSLQAPLHIPVVVIAVTPMCILVPLLIVVTLKLRKLGEPMDSTPNECWKGAILYYNPNDAALFVEKRDGLGLTFNFANPWAWVLLSGLALAIVSAWFVLR